MRLPSDHNERKATVTRREFLAGAARGAAALTLASTGFHVLSGCSGRRRDAPPKHVFLVSVDTLRADHLGCYKYRREKISPNIDQLAGEGVRFEHVVAQASWTKASFASMLTGLYPRNHGAVGRWTPLGSVPTLAQHLTAHGFTTVALVTNLYCSAHFGFAKGFRVFRETYFHHAAAKADYANAHLWKALDGLKRKRDDRLFVWVLYIDPHDPYDPPGKWASKFQDPGYPAAYPDFAHPSPMDECPVPVLTEKVKGDGQWTTYRVPVYQGINLYDGCIAWVDENIGQLRKGLDDRGLLDDSLIVFNSDHGEEWLEHDGVSHGGTLYEEQARVPLIFHCPSSSRVVAGGKVSGTVRVIDIAPTILEVAGVPPLPGDGASLAGALRDHRVQSRVAFAEELLDGAPARGKVNLQAVWRDNHKLIRIISQDGGWAHSRIRDKYMLFDLEHDRFERDDLIGNLDHAAVEADLRARLKKFGAQPQRVPLQAPAGPLPGHVRRNLEALGYLNKSKSPVAPGK